MRKFVPTVMRLARVVASGQVLLPAPAQRVAKPVLRTAPCLLGLLSLMCLIFAKHASQTGVARQFTTADDHIKLKRLYPRIQS